MSTNLQVNESPKHFMLLDAIARGVRDAGKISRVTKTDKAEVEMILNDLAVQRLVTIEKQKKSLFFGRWKSNAIHITDIGSRLLHSKKQELREKAGKLEEMYKNEDKRGIESFMNGDNNRMWLPMMIFSGIMSAMAFASMMSLVGMAMNPAESIMAGDATAVTGDDAQSATTDSSNINDGSADADTTNFDSVGVGGDDFGDIGGGDF
jgi:hypothetical protein